MKWLLFCEICFGVSVFGLAAATDGPALKESVSGTPESPSVVITSKNPLTKAVGKTDECSTYFMSLNSTLSLQCNSTGYPIPTYRWQSESRSEFRYLPNSGRRKDVNGLLKLKQLNTSDSGQYRCFSNNSEGNDTKCVHVIVYAIQQCSAATVTTRSPTSFGLSLACPPVDIRSPHTCDIRKYAVQYRVATSKQAFQEKVVSTSSTNLKHLTSYTEYEVCVKAMYMQHYCQSSSVSPTCVFLRTQPRSPPQPMAVNVIGITDTKATVTWDQPAHPDGISVRNNMTIMKPQRNIVVAIGLVKGMERRTVMDLRILTRYKVWIVAINEEKPQQTSSSDKIEFVTTGPSPHGLASKVTSSSAEISWDFAKELQSRVTSYLVKYSELGDRTWKTADSEGIKMSVTLSDLKSYTSYGVEVEGILDSDVHTKTVSHSFTTNQSAPSPPRDVKVRNVLSREVTTVWSPPTLANGQLAMYRVFVMISTSSVSNVDHRKGNSTVSGSETSAIITSLTPNTRYKVWVAAINVEGRELISKLGGSSAFTTNVEASSPPRNVTYFNVTSRSVVVQWLRPLTVHGTLFKYNVSLSVSGQELYRMHRRGKLVDGHILFLRLEKLIPFTEYRVQVQAGTIMSSPSRVLWSDPTEMVTFTTKQTFPSQPHGLRVEKNRLTSRSFWLQWQVPKRPNGDIQFYIVYLYEKNVSSNWTLTRFHRTTNSSREAKVTALTPYTKYKVAVAAVNTENGEELVSQSNRWIKVKTLDEEPNQPSNCLLRNRSDIALFVSWHSPPPGDYKVAFYEITYKPLNEADHEIRVYDESVWIRGLLSYTEYNVTVVAVTNNTVPFFGPPCYLTARTKIGALPRPDRPQLTDIVNESPSSITIILPSLNMSTSPIYYIEVFVVELMPGAPWSENRTLPSLGDDYVVQVYMAKNITSDYEGDRLVIGTGEGEDRLLKPYTTYAVHIRWSAQEDDGTQITSISLAKLYSTGSQGASSSSGSAVLIPAVVAVVVVLSVILVIIVVILIRRRRASAMSVSKDGSIQESSCTDYKDSPVVELSVSKVKEKYEEPVVYDVCALNGKTKKGVLIEEFEQHVEQLRADNSVGFIDEFDDLADTGTHQSSAYARRASNTRKNRYQNILPYDGQHVVLEELAGMSILETDYINATCLNGFGKKEAYLVTQGPMATTCHDFWRMVWQQNTAAIVMLTRAVESGKNKCKQYWLDDEPKLFDGLSVEVVSVVEFADYTVRSMRLQLLDEERIIKHYHFKSWPDHGVPTYATDLLGLMYRVRREVGMSTCPLLVHCSAGVGRSGTYVTIDTVLDSLNSQQTQTIDIPGVVRQLRMKRMEMVQSVLQYILIHDAVLEAFYVQKVEIKSSLFCEKFAQLSAQESGHSKLDEEFEILLKLSPPPDVSEFKTGLLPTVLRRKNRDSQFVPPDSVRVILHVDDDSALADYVNLDEGADYVNASYLNGFFTCKAFIVTQAPVECTMVDLWKMVYEQNVTAIVNLAQPHEQEIYWPESGSKSYGHFTVELTSSETKNSFAVHKLQMTKKQADVNIALFHYTAWSSDDPPSDFAGLLEMMSQLDQWQKMNKGCRIIVHCRTGMGRSGVFCAGFNALDQMQSEGVVNILHVAKILLNQRPGIIQTLSQYRTIYSIVDHHMRSSAIYANVK